MKASKALTVSMSVFRGRSSWHFSLSRNYFSSCSRFGAHIVSTVILTNYERSHKATTRQSVWTWFYWQLKTWLPICAPFGTKSCAHDFQRHGNAFGMTENAFSCIYDPQITISPTSLFSAKFNGNRVKNHPKLWTSFNKLRLLMCSPTDIWNFYGSKQIRCQNNHSHETKTSAKFLFDIFYSFFRYGLEYVIHMCAPKITF